MSKIYMVHKESELIGIFVSAKAAIKFMNEIVEETCDKYIRWAHEGKIDFWDMEHEMLNEDFMRLNASSCLSEHGAYQRWHMPYKCDVCYSYKDCTICRETIRRKAVEYAWAIKQCDIT